MREKDDLDLLLDSALSTYADPRAGLEDRVLSALDAAHIAAGSRGLQAPEYKQLGKMAFRPGPLSFQYIRAKYKVHISRRRLAWAVAPPLAACLLLLWLSTPKTIHAPSTSTQQAHQTNPSPPIPLAAAPQFSMHTSRRHTPRAIESALTPLNAQVADALPRPKLDVFPTPQPMSAEERALGLVAAQTPLPLRKALVEAQQDDLPIHIAATHIPPLESPDLGQP
jgi:hypothetical protein